ncbi:hypothetical protein [Specibacter sp. NPDC078692]|uniref:hypothetical protein n=1 Tax=Specibacter sp. NPDC078692 TaxID=3155818 RepID=UPI0034168A8B
MKQKWIFAALITLGLIMVAVSCISAIFLGNFPVFQVLVGLGLSGVGVIGYRMANRESD